MAIHSDGVEVVMYKLRNYQEFAVKRAIENLNPVHHSAKPFILQLATGAGKSLIIADIVHKMNTKIVVLQPSQELVAQNYEKMMSYEPDFEVGVYCAGLGRKEIKQVVYATINSVYKKADLFKEFEYVIIDECHQVDPKNLKGMYKTFLDGIDCINVCGLTATPYRMVQTFFVEHGQKYYTAKLKMINRIHPFFFRNIVCKVETEKLIEHGYLSPIVYHRIEFGGLDELKLNSNQSDYDRESIEAYWSSDSRLKKLAHVIMGVNGKCQRSLTFCSSLRQARRAREMLSELGIRAEMVDGSTPAKERDALVEAYRQGEFKHMLNVGVFTTGFDVPELDCIILSRPTMSLALYYQMVGRGVRLDPKRPDKKLRVYDLVRVTEKLGRVETIKVKKEVDINTGKPSFKDEVVSEAGKMSDVPLFTFAVNK